MYHIEMKKSVMDSYYKGLCESLRNNLCKELLAESPFGDEELKNSYSELLKSFLEINKIPSLEPLWSLICGTPDELLEFYNKNKNLFIALEKIEAEKKKNDNKYIPRLTKIFDYEKLVSKSGLAYSLTRDLNVNVCPYCNRSYVHTVFDFDDNSDRPNVIRPELDHFFPKSKYPMFALSIYNLIPSCHICNSNIKGKKELNIKKHYHPYIFENVGIKFGFTVKDDLKKTEIKIRCTPGKAKDTVDFFKLDKIYPYHNDESNHIYELYQEYPKEYIDNLNNILKDENVTISKTRLIKMIYDHYNVKNPDNEILGHLRNDLFEQIERLYFDIENTNQ